ncbi:MAG: hypothetical protein A2171_00480 [Candidatus Levybacteria bacterium RBG_13_35_9]|nr:MAG: hypothetical protein A2171_00480 [Candidatus Levybacteria bacterium RBG_13_35_9]
MGSIDEQLQKKYQPDLKPSRFGHHFNSTPQPDALGRAPATPLQILRAINGESPFPETEVVFESRPAPPRRHRKR